MAVSRTVSETFSIK